MSEYALTYRISLWVLGLSSAAIWAYASAFVVLVGVVIESVADLTNWIRPEKLKKRVEKIGALILVIGLAGDIASVGMAQIEAGELNQKAEDARERADSAAERTAQLIEEAAKLQKQAEDERSARVQLQEDVEPRRLSKSEQIVLSGKVSKYAGVAALIEYGTNSAEQYAFGSNIASALFLGRWQPSDPRPIMAFPAGPFAFGAGPHLLTGVMIESCPNDKSHNAGLSLRDGLILLGFDAISVPDNCAWVRSLGGQNATLTNVLGVHIMIEPRPEGPQGAAKLRHEHASKRHPQ